MNFTISIREKALTSSLDVLEEIHLKQSRGYKLIGFIRENQRNTFLTGSGGETFSTWEYMRKCIEELAANTSAAGINHFDIVTMENNQLGWAFVLLDSFPKSDMQAYIEWEAMQTWMKGAYHFSPYGVRTLSRSNIAEIEAGGEGNTDYPKYTRKSINEYRKAHFGLTEATMLELSVSETKNGERTIYHLAGVIQLNECVTSETCYYIEHLTRLLACQWEDSKMVLIVRDDPLWGERGVGRGEKVRVGYIAVYVRDIRSIGQGKMVEAFNAQIERMKKAFHMNFIFCNSKVKMCLAGDHTLRQIVKTNLINTFPNCFSNPSDEMPEPSITQTIREMFDLKDNKNDFSDTRNKKNVKSKLNVIK